jgi:hypothetical protein
MRPILLALQFSPYDQTMGQALGRLLADLEPAQNPYAGVLIVSRYDMPPEMELAKYMAPKFLRTDTYRCKRMGDGWPAGPNCMALEVYNYFAEQNRSKRWDYAAIMLLEPDSIPLAKDWIRQIHDEWGRLRSSVHVLGPWLLSGDTQSKMDHINGNCLFSPKFREVCRRFVLAPKQLAWDAYFAYDMMEWGHPSRLIWSDYYYDTYKNPWRGEEVFWEPKRYNLARHPLYGEELHPVWFHGIKTMRGQESCRKHFGL